MALVGKVQKKRAWGKSAERKKITVIENMNLHVPDEPKTTSKVMEDGKNSLQSEKDSEWMHPEILPTERLKEILTDMKVPMAMDGATDRDDLVRLFRKHLLPRPQRKRYKRETRQKAWGLQETAAKAGNEMEWDDSCCTDALAMAAIDSISDRTEKDIQSENELNEPNPMENRKRKMAEGDEESPSKLPSLAVDPVTPLSAGVHRHSIVRKLKRPSATPVKTLTKLMKQS